MPTTTRRTPTTTSVSGVPASRPGREGFPVARSRRLHGDGAHAGGTTGPLSWRGSPAGFTGPRRIETDPGPTSRATERRAGVFFSGGSCAARSTSSSASSTSGTSIAPSSGRAPDGVIARRCRSSSTTWRPGYGKSAARWRAARTVGVPTVASSSTIRNGVRSAVPAGARLIRRAVVAQGGAPVAGVGV